MNLARAAGAAALALLVTAVPALAQNVPSGPRPGIPGGAPGQQMGGTVHGVVRDAAGEPVASAQVSLWSAADSALVTGAVADRAGAFRIEGVRPGRYYLRVSALGHATGTVPSIAITPQAREADVGTVRLGAGAVQLEGITVTAERSAAAFAPDRNTYRAADLPAAVGGTTTDVLRNIPAVEVDHEGRVSLRGNQNVAVQINGRPAPMRGEQLANFLQQLPANMVETVEVIPNPSARYEPEGMAGIINIVLRQNADLGLSYGVVLGAGTGGRYNGSGNVGFQRGPLTLYGSYGYRNDERRNTGFNYLERYATAGGDPLSVLQQDVTGRFDTESHLFNGSADLRLGRRSVLSSTIMLSSGGFDNRTDNLYLELGPEGQPVRRYAGLNRIAIDDLTFDGGLAFKHTLVPQRHEISAEVRHNRGDNRNFNRFSEAPRDLSGAPTGGLERLENTITESDRASFTAQADYTHPLAERTRLEAGYKGTFRGLQNDMAVEGFDHDQQVWVPNTGRSNTFEYDETVHAGYAVLSQGAGRVDLQAGLRAERTDREFYLANTDERFPRDYWSFFPSGLVAVNLDDRRQVRASLSRRIQRPDTRILNPFPFNEDQLNRFVGNPALDPEYTTAMELGYQHAFPRGSFQATPYYRHTENAIRRFVEVRGDTTISTFRNLATARSYGMDVNGSLRMDRISGFAGVSAYRTVTDGTNLGDQLSSDALGWSTRINATYKVTPRLDLTAFAMYRAPMKTEQGRMGAFTMTTLVARQRVLGDRANLSLRLVDPFDTMGFRMRTEQPLYLTVNERRFGGRAAHLTFTYNYGQQPRLRQRPQEAPETTMPGQIGPG